ncbi:erythromycin esterase family protein [Couchioplanes caeruleus]|uniref:erythromycin esterase family protein n=1 Tax=Couchioplanes caeruleus TaxID=56438 RepID=UPI0020BFE781|nr:erythromycin esterase family protein [Couchioplanes caeruleus]UQU63194.1 erythromycin esterase family protein [Couchioplanes caeruleus]
MPFLPLDDLEPLAELVRDAKVVAIGESAHHVREYHDVRHRLTRILVERHGFSVFAMESGFSEGLAVDAWVRGGPGDLDDLAERHITYRMGQCAEMREHLLWMRSAGVRFSGIDVPGSATSPLPGLLHLRDLPPVDEIIALVETYAKEPGLSAYAAYAAMPQPDRDRITALLADLTVRVGTGAPDPTARREVRLVVLLDQLLRGNVAARDLGMAETVLDLVESGAKVVVGAANGHIQRTPMALPGVEVPTMGTHLTRRLGDAYAPVALTATTGITPTRRRDPHAPGGVAVVGVPLPEAREDSVEAAGPGTLLRGAFGTASWIRVLDGWQETDLAAAYDAVVNVGSISPAAQVDGLR